MNTKVINQAHGTDWTVYQGDSIEVLKGIPDDSVHYNFFSPPFKSLFVFSDSPRDMSNSNDDQFWQHMRYLAAEQYRVTMPGRLLSFHCCNLPLTKGRDGHIGLQDFRGEMIRLYLGDAATLVPAITVLRRYQSEALARGDFQAVEALQFSIHTIEKQMEERSPTGWIFSSEVVIWKDPIVAMQRTKSPRLLHKQMIKDSSISGAAIPDYVITMRKPGENPEPIAGLLFDYVGDNPEFQKYAYKSPDFLAYFKKLLSTKFSLSSDEMRRSIDIWSQYASPVWMDIRPGDTLQRLNAKENGDERHITPTQLDVTRRCLQLYSNPGDVVVDPCNGIGTTGYVALEQKRKYIGIELKGSYFDCTVGNLKTAENSQQGQLAFA